MSLDSLVELTNDPRFLTGIVPAANTITTAWELSRFFEVMRCGGELDGVRVIETDTIRRALEERSHLEVDLSLGYPTRFSYGLMLGARVVSLYGLDTQHAFGHLGFTNMLAWADPERSHLGGRAQQRQADRLSRDLPLPGHDAEHHLGHAEGVEI